MVLEVALRLNQEDEKKLLIEVTVGKPWLVSVKGGNVVVSVYLRAEMDKNEPPGLTW